MVYKSKEKCNVHEKNVEILLQILEIRQKYDV